MQYVTRQEEEEEEEEEEPAPLPVPFPTAGKAKNCSGNDPLERIGRDWQKECGWREEDLIIAVEEFEDDICQAVWRA